VLKTQSAMGAELLWNLSLAAGRPGPSQAALRYHEDSVAAAQKAQGGEARGRLARNDQRRWRVSSYADSIVTTLHRRRDSMWAKLLGSHEGVGAARYCSVRVFPNPQAAFTTHTATPERGDRHGMRALPRTASTSCTSIPLRPKPCSNARSALKATAESRYRFREYRWAASYYCSKQ
jgi:hypothetical protein